MPMIIVGLFPIRSGHLPYLQHSSPVQSKMSSWLSMYQQMTSHALYIPPVKQMGKHAGSISSSRSITSTVDPLKMEWISRISFLQMLNLELLAASITIVALWTHFGDANFYRYLHIRNVVCVQYIPHSCFDFGEGHHEVAWNRNPACRERTQVWPLALCPDFKKPVCINLRRR